MKEPRLKTGLRTHIDLQQYEYMYLVELHLEYKFKLFLELNFISA